MKWSENQQQQKNEIPMFHSYSEVLVICQNVLSF